MGRTEIASLPFVIGFTDSGFFIDLHSTYWIFDHDVSPINFYFFYSMLPVFFNSINMPEVMNLHLTYCFLDGSFKIKSGEISSLKYFFVE
jgi:hypothetical protein